MVYATDLHVTLCDKRGLFPGWWCPVADQDSLRKYSLECLRLATECEQLARDAESPALRQHFHHMAEIWTGLAERGLGADCQAKAQFNELVQTALAMSVH